MMLLPVMDTHPLGSTSCGQHTLGQHTPLENTHSPGQYTPLLGHPHGQQAGSTHPTTMFSCFCMFLTFNSKCTSLMSLTKEYNIQNCLGLRHKGNGFPITTPGYHDNICQ